MSLLENNKLKYLANPIFLFFIMALCHARKYKISPMMDDYYKFYDIYIRHYPLVMILITLNFDDKSCVFEIKAQYEVSHHKFITLEELRRI